MSVIALLSILLLAAPAVAAEESTLTVETGPPVLRSSFTPKSLYGRTTFEETVQRVPGAAIHTWPEELPEDARFGFFETGGISRSFVVLPSGDGVRMLLDLDADGDLTDDRRLPMTTDGSTGFDGGLLHAVTVSSGPGAPFKLAVERHDDGKLESRFFHYHQTLREGRIPLGERSVIFAVAGVFGTFDAEYNEVFFDVDGDGEIAAETIGSDEIYRLGERFVNLFGTTYEFSVSGEGDRLTLTPQAETRPGRVRLDPGNVAPDFPFEDLDGQIHNLSDFRGKIVLLYGWATWCGPCLEETPRLIDAYARYAELGFEILAVSKDASREMVDTYIAEHGATWPQTVQGPDSSILDLYRVDGIPSYFLIDRDGVIVDREVRGATLEARLAELLEQQPGSSDVPPPLNFHRTDEE